MGKDNLVRKLNFSVKFYSHQLMHFFIQLCISLLSYIKILISSFRRVQNVVCFLLGDSPESYLYMPTFRNTLSVPSSKAFEVGTDRVFRNVGIYKSDAGESPKKTNNILKSLKTL